MVLGAASLPAAATAAAQKAAGSGSGPQAQPHLSLSSRSPTTRKNSWLGRLLSGMAAATGTGQRCDERRQAAGAGS